MDLYQGVNKLLKAIGEIPITDNTQALTALSTDDVGMARDNLLSMSKSIQTTGYWFNKETNYPLMPNSSGYIAISDTILDIGGNAELIVKDHKLYNTTDKSFVFTEPQEVTITFYLQFDDLHPTAADAIVREATREFYNDILGDTQEAAILGLNADKAMLQLQKKQLAHRKINLMSGSRLLDRTTNPTAIS